MPLGLGPQEEACLRLSLADRVDGAVAVPLGLLHESDEASPPFQPAPPRPLGAGAAAAPTVRLRVGSATVTPWVTAALAAGLAAQTAGEATRETGGAVAGRDVGRGRLAAPLGATVPLARLGAPPTVPLLVRPLCRPSLGC